jgi:hypothetical protein
MGKPPPTRELCRENDSDNDDDDSNDTVSDEHVMPPPNHEALHCNQPQPFIVQSRLLQVFHPPQNTEPLRF